MGCSWCDRAPERLSLLRLENVGAHAGAPFRQTSAEDLGIKRENGSQVGATGPQAGYCCCGKSTWALTPGPRFARQRLRTWGQRGKEVLHFCLTGPQAASPSRGKNTLTVMPGSVSRADGSGPGGNGARKLWPDSLQAAAKEYARVGVPNFSYFERQGRSPEASGRKFERLVGKCYD